ncbi:MAG TPA: glycosyltransferase 87 family protein [Gaiellaceae bacterium]|nr:glycosyltransferase 87 family protein [Gaiellaceae bacterium]
MRRSRLPDALAASGVFLACWGLVHTWFWSRGQLVDWPVYREYGRAIVEHGRVPYRDFAVEYPPGSLPVFVVPAPFGDYAGAFAWLMATLGVALVFVLSAVSRRAAWFVAVTPVLAGSLILSRFDLWPALLAAAALVLLLRGRPGWAWALLGLAISAKLWPAVLVPLFLLRTRRGVGWGVTTLALAFVPFLVLAPGGLWHSITGQASRPLQIESLAASFVTTFGSPEVVSGHGSQNLAGYGGLAAVASVVQVLAVVAVWLSYARTRRDVERHSAAAVAAFVAFGKVLSPQFLLWLAPLVPLVRGRRGLAATGLLTAAFVLTQVWFPQRYWDYADHLRLAGVVLVRDVVLVALVAVLAWPARLARSH